MKSKCCNAEIKHIEEFLVCTKCEKTCEPTMSEGLTEKEEEVVEEDMSDEAIAKNKADFRKAHIELYGTCPDCKKEGCMCYENYIENQIGRTEWAEPTYQEREDSFINNFGY